jgi:hypothetical protein
MPNRNSERNKAMTDAEREHAKQFRDRFGGEFIVLAKLPTLPDIQTSCDQLFAEQRHRYGRCVNCDD